MFTQVSQELTLIEANVTFETKSVPTTTEVSPALLTLNSGTETEADVYPYTPIGFSTEGYVYSPVDFITEAYDYSPIGFSAEGYVYSPVQFGAY